MPDLRDLPEGTIWPHLLDDVESQVLQHLAEYAQARQSDIARGAESPALAALLVEKYSEGMARALSIMGMTSKVLQLGDRLVRELDPAYDENRKARWQARPAALTYE